MEINLKGLSLPMVASTFPFLYFVAALVKLKLFFFSADKLGNSIASVKFIEQSCAEENADILPPPPFEDEECVFIDSVEQVPDSKEEAAIGTSGGHRLQTNEAMANFDLRLVDLAQWKKRSFLQEDDTVEVYATLYSGSDLTFE